MVRLPQPVSNYSPTIPVQSSGLVGPVAVPSVPSVYYPVAYSAPPPTVIVPSTVPPSSKTYSVQTPSSAVPPSAAVPSVVFPYTASIAPVFAPSVSPYVAASVPSRHTAQNSVRPAPSVATTYGRPVKLPPVSAPAVVDVPQGKAYYVGTMYNNYMPEVGKFIPRTEEFEDDIHMY